MKPIQNLGLRILCCFLPISVISFLVTPITIHLTYLLTSLFYPVILTNNILTVNHASFSVIEACVASFAFYFLWLLAMLTKNITWKQRWKLVGVCWGALVLVNVVRIFVLIAVAQTWGWAAFDAVHMIMWQVVSGIFVAAIWIAAVTYFKVKSIPVVDDLVWLYKQSYFSKSFKGGRNARK